MLFPRSFLPSLYNQVLFNLIESTMINKQTTDKSYLIYIYIAYLSCALSRFPQSDFGLHCFYKSNLKPELALKLGSH